MYQIQISGQSEVAVRFKIQKDATLLSFQEVFHLWQNDVSFVDFYCKSLTAFGFLAYFWEHPGLNNANLDRPYECILQKSRTLDKRTINENAFSDYLNSKEDAEDFMNLGKNARLVIPTKKSSVEIYKHLGSFLRLAERQQIRALFQKTGQLVLSEIEQQEMIWLNTAGMGVIWLHIRMDTSPKYYKTKNYKRIDFYT